MIGCDCDVCRSTDPRDKRTRPSVYLELDDDFRALVDTTPDLRAQALRQDLRRLDAILFTHAHADHVMGLDEVRRFNVINKAPVPVFADDRTLAELSRTFAYAFDANAPKGGGVPDLRLWRIGGTFMLGRQEVTPVPLVHGPWRILGFRFGRFAYLTDCSGVPDSSVALLGGLHTLVLDALLASGEAKTIHARPGGRPSGPGSAPSRRTSRTSRTTSVMPRPARPYRRDGPGVDGLTLMVS